MQNRSLNLCGSGLKPLEPVPLANNYSRNLDPYRKYGSRTPRSSIRSLNHARHPDPYGRYRTSSSIYFYLKIPKPLKPVPLTNNYSRNLDPYRKYGSRSTRSSIRSLNHARDPDPYGRYRASSNIYFYLKNFFLTYLILY
jgi:hypothetical protein